LLGCEFGVLRALDPGRRHVPLERLLIDGRLVVRLGNHRAANRELRRIVGVKAAVPRSRIVLRAGNGRFDMLRGGVCGRITDDNLAIDIGHDRVRWIAELALALDPYHRLVTTNRGLPLGDRAIALEQPDITNRR
jgi:hypothetical protein